jgi:hypothetical protein
MTDNSRLPHADRVDYSRTLSSDGRSVDGITIIERQRAHYTAESTPNEKLIGVVVDTVDELLLDDESMAYTCVHPKRGACNYTASKLRSVTAHQRSHSANTLLKIKERELAKSTQKLAEIEQKQAESRQRRSEGVKRGHEERAKRLQNGDVTASTTASDTVSDVVTNETDHKQFIQLGTKLGVALTEMLNAQNEFKQALENYMIHVGNTAYRSTVDPVIAKKAQNWDKYIEFQNLIK